MDDEDTETETNPKAPTQEPSGKPAPPDPGGSNLQIEEKITLEKTAFNERLAQAKSAATKDFLKELGFVGEDGKPHDTKSVKEWVEAQRKAHAEAQKRADAEKSEIERITGAHKELEAKYNQATSALKEAQLRQSVYETGLEMGVASEQQKTALALYKLHVSETDEPKDIKRFLEEAKTKSPFLFAKTATVPAGTGAPSGSGSGQSKPADTTGKKHYKDMTPDERTEFRKTLGVRSGF